MLSSKKSRSKYSRRDRSPEHRDRSSRRRHKHSKRSSSSDSSSDRHHHRKSRHHYDSHSRHHKYSRRSKSRSNDNDRHSHRRRRSPSPQKPKPSTSILLNDNPADDGGIKINLKPLVLASDDSKTKEKDIKYIEGNTFVQNSFKSTRDEIDTINPLSNPNGISFVQSGSNSYKKLVQERAHEEAIFGRLDVTETESLVCRLSLANTPGDSGFVSSIDKIKTIVNPKLNADQKAAWSQWKERLISLKHQKKQCSR